MRTYRRNREGRVYFFTLVTHERRRAREGHLPVYRQLIEITFLLATRGIGYDMYHYAGMWDKNASWDYKCSFFSYKDYGRKIYQLNARKFHGMS